MTQPPDPAPTPTPGTGPVSVVRQRPRRSVGIFIRDAGIVIVIAVLASFLIKTFLVRSFYIPSVSMQDTLQPNDRVLVDELVPRLIPVQRGDVVVFKDPGGWLDATAPVAPTPLSASADWLLSLVGLSPTEANDHLIKRVIGLPGDHVSCCTASGQVSVNGVALTEPYRKPGSGEITHLGETFDTVVPAGQVWVEGDNRDNSKDSRFQRGTPDHGFVPESDLVGRAFVISWPISRWTVLSDFPGTFARVPDTSR